MAARSTSSQRLGALMLVVAMAAMIGVVWMRRCSDGERTPVEAVKMKPDSIPAQQLPDSARIRTLKKKKPKSKSKRTRSAEKKRTPLPSGSPLDYKM